MQMIKQWLLIKPDPRKESRGGIIIAEQTGKEKVGHSTGVIVSCPDELWPKDLECAKPCTDPGFSVGDRVVYRDYLKDLHEIDYQGARHCFIHWQDLIAVIGPEVDIEW